MERLMAYCGIDCGGCEAYLATQADDREAKLALLKKWQVEYHEPEMSLEAVTCDGCTSTGRLGGYTHACPVHICARAKGVQTCAHCAAYEGCETLHGFIVDIPEAQANLAGLRAGL